MPTTVRLPRCLKDTAALARRLLVPLALVAGVAAQQIESTAWGFDGVSVAPGFFNPLTVVVVNPSNAPVDATLMLLEGNGLLDLGAPLAERCYLAPGARRVVQFHPFVTSSERRWSLRWANAGFARIDVRPQPDSTWRGAVVLCEGDAPRGPMNRLPTFPAAWFPAIPGAAEALADVVLDFTPEWDDARALAFLAWLRAGGRVHLALRDDLHPTFAGPLAVLGDPRSEFAVGAGQVVRYPRPLAELTGLLLVRPPPPPADVAPPAARAPGVLSDMQLSLLPTHAWGWIFFAAVLFLICVGPLHWQLARRRIDWRLSIAYLLGVVVLFTILFGWLGARGYDEVSRVRTLAYARVCGDGEVAATQYTIAFVTTGGRREIRPRAAACLVSTAQIHESVDGVIDNGVGGRLVVDMPMFSARGLVHRAHYRAADLPRLRALDADQFVLDGTTATPLGGFLLRNGGLYRLQAEGTRLVVSGPAPTRDEAARMMGEVAREPLALAQEIVSERLQIGVGTRNVFGAGGSRVFVLLRSPPELLLDPAAGLGNEDGLVLLDYDVERD